MSKTRTHRLIAAGLAIVALVLTLVGCGGSGSTSSSSTASATGASTETNSSTRTTLLDERLYDLDEVDDEIFAKGEEYVQGCIEVIDYLNYMLENAPDADSDEQAEMKAELESLVGKVGKVKDEFLALVQSKPDMNLETQLYCLEVASYSGGLENFGNVYSNAIKAALAGSSSNAATSPETQAEPEEPEATSEPADNGEVDPTVREFCDTYEAFVDEYVAFMQRYNNASSDEQAAMMNDYLGILQRYTDMATKMDAMTENEDTWNEATYLYYSEVMLRCSQKLLEAY